MAVLDQIFKAYDVRGTVPDQLDATRADLVIIDPLSAYFGTSLDSYRDTDVRAVLEPVSKLAERRWQLAPSSDQGGQPAGVEPAGVRGRSCFAPHVRVRVDDAAGHGQMHIHRLACDEQVHDLG